MRFTTLSTFTNAFIISTIALLSLLQVANATEINIYSPNGTQYSPGDLVTVKWCYSPGIDLSGANGTLYLRNSDFHYRHKFQKVSLGANSSNIVLPVPGPAENVFPGKNYYFEITTSFGDFNGYNFTIAYNDTN